MRVPGSNPVPRDVRDEISGYAAEFTQLRAADSARLERMRAYRTENEVVRDLDLDADIGALDYDRRRPSTDRRHRIPLPYGRALTVKHANRIAGPTRIPDVVVERREETPQERYRSDTMEKIVWGVFRESDGKQQLASGAWDGSELGAACFEIYWDIVKQMPYFRAVDPEGVLVVRGVNDPHDFQRLYRFWQVPLASLKAEYRDREFAGVPVLVDDIKAKGGGLGQMVEVVQVSTRTSTVRFTGSEHGAVGLERRDHNYGFVNYAVVTNLGPERKVWGWADYEFVRALVRYIPVLFGREADILRMVANGAMQLKGNKLSAQKVQEVLRKGGVLPVGKDGSVDPINVPEVPSFEGEHAGRALTMLQDLGFSPPAAWGAGGAGSGSDRGLQLAPIAELAQMKQVNWGSGLSRLGSMIFRMIEQKQADTATYRGVAQRGPKRYPFSLQIGPGLDPVSHSAPSEEDPEGEVLVPSDPKELFDGDYACEFTWADRHDIDDPSYVASELNKFAQGVQSLRTTLERLGVKAPEDEIKLIEDENEKHPWLRQGMIKLLELQLNASQQGNGGGGDQRSSGDRAGGALSTMLSDGGGDSGALDADAGTGALRGGVGTLYGAA